MGADVGELCGGVHVKPTFDGRVHTMYAATLCRKPRFATECTSIRRNSGWSTS